MLVLHKNHFRLPVIQHIEFNSLYLRAIKLGDIFPLMPICAAVTMIYDVGKEMTFS